MAEEEIISVRQRAETSEETRQREEMAQLVWRSPDRLEDAARQVIQLVTALYAVVFGVLAFANNPLPAYLTWPYVRWLGAASITLLGLALAAALRVVLPRKLEVADYSLDRQRASFAELLQHKHAWLRRAIFLFGAGLLAFGLLLLIVIFNVV